MKEIISIVKDLEKVKIFVPLITGITVFILTSLYNHLKDRKMYIKSLDTELLIHRGKRAFVEPVNNKINNGQHKLLMSKRYVEAKEDNDKKHEKQRSEFLLIENTTKNKIYNIKITNKLMINGKKFTDHFVQFYMEGGEVFYIFLPFRSENDDKSPFLKAVVKYKTLAGTRYSISYKVFENRRLRSKFHGIRIKCRIILWFIPIPVEFDAYQRKYNTQSKVLMKK